MPWGRPALTHGVLVPRGALGAPRVAGPDPFLDA